MSEDEEGAGEEEDGARCFRCLRVIPEDCPTYYGVHTYCFQTWFQDAFRHYSPEYGLPVFMGLMDPNLPPLHFPVFISLMDPKYKNSELPFPTFQGAAEKYSAILGSKDYILKVQECEYPELPRVEYLCNQIAQSLGIPVPDYYYLEFDAKLEYEYDIPVFVVKNFMSERHAANLVHLYHYLEPAAEFDRQKFNCEAVINAILENVRGGGASRDVSTFIRTCLFDALIGNHDRHGKNLAFIEDKNGKTLAPIYDNISYVGIEQIFLECDLEPKGKIATKAVANPSMKDYIIEFTRLGHQASIDAFKESVNLEEIIKLIDCSFITLSRQKCFKRLINKRFKELMNG